MTVQDLVQLRYIAFLANPPPLVHLQVLHIAVWAVRNSSSLKHFRTWHWKGICLRCIWCRRVELFSDKHSLYSSPVQLTLTNLLTSNSLMALNAVGWCWASPMPESPFAAVPEGERSPASGPMSSTTWWIVSSARRMCDKTRSRVCLAVRQSEWRRKAWKAETGMENIETGPRKYTQNVPQNQIMSLSFNLTG